MIWFLLVYILSFGLSVGLYRLMHGKLDCEMLKVFALVPGMNTFISFIVLIVCIVMLFESIGTKSGWWSLYNRIFGD